MCTHICTHAHTHSHSSLHTYTPRLMEFQNVCHIFPGAVSHHSDIVTLYQNNLAGISLKLHKMLYPLPINYSSRGAYVAARRSCEVSSSPGLCMEAIPSRHTHFKYISVQTREDYCERTAAKSSAGGSSGCVSAAKCTSICCLTCIEWCVCMCCCLF